MAKMVGLSRKIKLSWLNKAAQLYNESLSQDDYKAKLNEYLSYEIDSAIVLRKTREILMNVWFYENDPFITSFRKEAAALLRKYPEENVPIHWCLLLLAYPVMVDMSKMIGRFSEFSDTITLKQIKQKIFDDWGERATLSHTTDKIIATMMELGAISRVSLGTYRINKHRVKAEDVTLIIIQTAMKTGDTGYCDYNQLSEFNVLFPFEYKVSRENLIEDDRFILSNMGGELTVALK